MSEILGHWIKGDIGKRPIFVPHLDADAAKRNRDEINKRLEALVLAEARLAEILKHRAGKHALKGSRPTSSLVKAIIDCVAVERGVDAEKIARPCREHPVSHARFIVFKRLRDLGHTLPGIALAFGMDHTSVLHGIRRLKFMEASHD